MAGGGGGGGGGGSGDGGGGGGGGSRLNLHLRPCGGGGIAGSDSVSDYPPSAAAARSREAAAAALHAARTLLGAGVANPCSPTPEPPFWKMPHKGWSNELLFFHSTGNLRCFRETSSSRIPSVSVAVLLRAGKLLNAISVAVLHFFPWGLIA